MSDAYASAVRLLARREHGAYELIQKLVQKGHPETEAQEALNECQRLGFQSDARFAETLLRTRVRQGYGPLRIQHELQRLRIDSELISNALFEEEENWLSCAQAVLDKKYGPDRDAAFEAAQKQKQFLSYRGFTNDVISKVFNR